MGCPSIYYKQALQYFARSLGYAKDSELGEELFKEQSEEILEKFILREKEQTEEKFFYYDAGMASRLVLYDAEREGCDAFNAAIGGLIEFEHFIGLLDGK